MKVLFPVPECMANPHVYELAVAISSNTRAQVTISLDDFWQCSKKYDVVHIHWPEALTGWKYSADLNAKTQKVLKYWKSKAKIVYTCHNYLPHNNANKEADQLYQLVYLSSDAIIHMGSFSKNLLAGKMPHLQAIHEVIPHLIYSSYPNTVSRDEARKKLGIASDSFVMLSFGMLRHEEEKKLLLDGFKYLKHPKKLLLTPWWTFSPNFWKRQLEKIYYRLHPLYNFTQQHIPDNEVQYYFNAADVLFLARVKHFNSANIILAFTFGKVVIGPDHGNVGEILMATDNPVYCSGDTVSIKSAVNQSIPLTDNKQGCHNLSFANENWNAEIVSTKHEQLYEKLHASVSNQLS
jgi:glycosyltransferase involved in cell wall biosynthesis